MNYETREFQSQKDNQHHVDIYGGDGKLKNSYIWDGQVWIEEQTGIVEDNVQDIIEKNVRGDLDEYEIREQNAYGVKYTYYTLYDSEEEEAQ